MTRAAAVVLLSIMAWPLGARAEGPIRTAGEGVIRVCRDWIWLEGSCRDYHHVKLPAKISVGDVFRVEYGSNPKGYQFHVGRIAVESGTCSIYNGQTGFSRDSITVACNDAE